MHTKNLHQPNNKKHLQTQALENQCQADSAGVNMFRYLLPLALVSISRGTEDVLTDIDCVVRMEAMHECAEE